MTAKVLTIVWLLSLALAGGCAAARSAAPAQPGSRASTQGAPGDSLDTFIAKVRAASERARPARAPVSIVESRDPALAAALAAATAEATPVTYRRVAEAYRARGILDTAHEYLNAARRLNPASAETHDALARMWRDWKLPRVGLSDAYRAVHYAPDWAVAWNTLGTLFQSLGRRADARRAYERALELDPGAAYALNNLCYGWMLEGEAARAVAACEHALRLQPGLSAARNNLGLAHAVGGNLDAARASFASTGNQADTFYNMGIVQLARRRYGDAVKAFEAAQALRPSFALAAARVRQARNQAHRSVDP